MTDLDALALHLARGPAPTLAAAVHRRDPDTIAAILDGLDRQELYALAVVLADEVVIDDVAVDRVVAGGRESLNRAERAEAVHRLLGRGYAGGTVAKYLNLSGTTALRLINAHPDAPKPTTNPTEEGNAA